MRCAGAAEARARATSTDRTQRGLRAGAEGWGSSPAAAAAQRLARGHAGGGVGALGVLAQRLGRTIHHTASPSVVASSVVAAPTPSVVAARPRARGRTSGSSYNPPCYQSSLDSSNSSLSCVRASDVAPFPSPRRKGSLASHCRSGSGGSVRALHACVCVCVCVCVCGRAPAAAACPAARRRSQRRR